MHLKLLNIECFTLVQFMCVDHAVWQNTLDKTCVDCTCVKIRAQFDPVDEVDVQWGAGTCTCTGTARPGGCPVGGSLVLVQLDPVDVQWGALSGRFLLL